MGMAPIVWMFTILVFVGIIFSKVKQLGGWSYWEVIFLTGVHEIVFLLTWSTILVNLRNFVNDVRLGRADYDFLRPISSRFLISFRTIDFTNIGSLVNIIIIFVYSLGKVAATINLNRLPGFVILLIISYVISYLVYFILASLCLFLVNAKSFLDWAFELTDFDRYPADIYPDSARTFLTFFLPILFFAYIPTAYLLGKLTEVYIIWGLLIILILFTFSHFLWHKGLKKYQSASG